MSTPPEHYIGRWLNRDDRHGKDFSHELPEYEHSASSDCETTPMRHAYLDRNGEKVGVWVPVGWSDEEAREALETNW